MKEFEDPFLKILPKIDLHSETRDTVLYLVSDFIRVQKLLGHEKLVIIHGRHGGVLRREVHEILRRRKDVEKFYVYGSNDGLTVVELRRTAKKL